MKAKGNRFLVFLILAMGLNGCITTQRYMDTNYPPTNARDIEVVDLHQIQHKYVILGMVQCNTEFGNVKYLREKAAELGANAISIPDTRGDIMRSQAIRYKD